MNEFTLSFFKRQIAQLIINQYVTLYTTYGNFLVQYVPCSERFSIKDGCQNWTYTFCVSDSDLPSGLDVCNITPDIIEEPFLLAIPPCSIVGSDTITITGAGTQLNPKQIHLKIDPDSDNDIEVRAGGVFIEETGVPGPPGDPGTNGTNGSNGSNGTNGADGTNGTDGAAGANGAGPPVGMIFPVPGTSAPANTEPLWGQLINRVTWPELWNFAIASGNLIDDATWLGDPANVGKFSSGDGVNTFRVPNLRGYFLRVWNSNDGGLYPDDDRDFASVQEDGIEDHTHTLGNDADAGGGATPNVNQNGSIGGANDGIFSGSVFGTDQATFEGIDETRPKNIAYMYVIQAASVV